MSFEHGEHEKLLGDGSFAIDVSPVAIDLNAQITALEKVLEKIKNDNIEQAVSGLKNAKERRAAKRKIAHILKACGGAGVSTVTAAA